jgi:hypothetical protein
MDSSGFISLEVEDNDNCPGLPLMTYQTLGQPTRAAQVRVAGPRGPEELHWVTGWQEDDGSPCPAHYVPVSDSGAGMAYLLYGGDWGIRMKPVSLDEEWSKESSNQWGAPWLLLSEESDIVADSNL